ncbi:hypothetical protein GCM10023334_087660 [Nonomuraea thailandensis]
MLGREVPLNESSVCPFLDDFTVADLRNAHLAGVDPVGVRWSEAGNRWPEEVDVEALKAHSGETTPGSGVYARARRRGGPRHG